MLDDINMKQLAVLIQKCDNLLANEPIEAMSACNKITNYLGSVNGGVLSYDSRIFGDDQGLIDGPLIDWLSTDSTQLNETFKLLHVDQSTKTPVFEFGSDSVWTAYKSDGIVSYADDYDKIVGYGVPLIIMAAEYDQKDGARGMVDWMKEVFPDSQNLKEFWTEKNPRQIYYFNVSDEFGGANQVGGYFRTDGVMTYITVPKGGHMIPITNYDAVA